MQPLILFYAFWKKQQACLEHYCIYPDYSYENSRATNMKPTKAETTSIMPPRAIRKRLALQKTMVLKTQLGMP
jgi:hypothetical protein